jgi:hypothetical protein
MTEESIEQDTIVNLSDFMHQVLPRGIEHAGNLTEKRIEARIDKKAAEHKS